MSFSSMRQIVFVQVILGGAICDHGLDIRVIIPQFPENLPGVRAVPDGFR